MKVIDGYASMEKTYTIALTNSTRKVSIKGEPIIIEGFEEFEFFIHKSWDNKDTYNVSEASTGLAILYGSSESKEEAINATKEILSKQGKKKLIEAIEAGKRFFCKAGKGCKALKNRPKEE